MTVILPKLNQTGKNEWADVESNDVALKEAIESLQSEVAAISGLKRYTPKVIATEQERTSTEYGFLTTEDKIENVVVAENAVVQIQYEALWKESVSNAGRAAIFIGANQLKIKDVSVSPPAVQAARTGGSEAAQFVPLLSSVHGLVSAESSGESTSVVTTGMPVALGGTARMDINDGTSREVSSPGGLVTVRNLAAGTYTIGVKFKSTSGKVTVKSRALKIWTIG